MLTSPFDNFTTWRQREDLDHGEHPEPAGIGREEDSTGYAEWGLHGGSPQEVVSKLQLR